ncbi:MAG: type I glutamate--ammonia ligase, partial [Candidatus Zophobacter franzmannii]|nr:type I glutamate--ammonia ligase [Candidatus Zophobacter franzmannii]
LEQIREMIKNGSLKTIDLKYAGLSGKWYHITFPARRLENVLEFGVPFDGSSIPGMKSVESGDMVLMPDPTSAHLDPLRDNPTLRLICSICDADTRIGIKKDPRSVAHRAQKYLESTGLADTSLWTPEYEFHLFDSVDYINDPFNTGYSFTSSEDKAAMTDDIDDRQGLSQQNVKGYHMDDPFDSFFDLREEVVMKLEDLGIKVRYHHHEVGLHSQQEIETELLPFPKICDDHKVIMDLIRRVALQYDATATFMPKPVYKEAGNGMHFHMMLKKDGKNIFYNKGGSADLSDEAIWFMAGILKHGRSICAFTNPSTNSYKRLLPGYEAPVKLFFGLANRSAAIRIPKYATEENTKRFEFRTGDATCNPYLAMSALLMAGLDGIKNKYNPADFNFGPYDENIFAWSEEKKAELSSVPANLEEALDALKEDHEYLLAGDVFNKELIESHINEKMKEVHEVNNRPHPYEMNLYYNV